LSFLKTMTNEWRSGPGDDRDDRRDGSNEELDVVDADDRYATIILSAESS